MTRSHRNQKKTTILDPPAGKENAKASGTSKARRHSKRGALKQKLPTVASEAKVGLLVTAELEKAMEECRTKVAQIVKGCRAANTRFRYLRCWLILILL